MRRRSSKTWSRRWSRSVRGTRRLGVDPQGSLSNPLMGSSVARRENRGSTTEWRGMEKIWLKQYPAGVPAEVKTDVYPSLVALLDESFRKHAELPAYRFMGKGFSFAQIDDLSRAFAAYLQGLGLARGDRVAIMMPNVPQYPVAVAGILRA